MCHFCGANLSDSNGCNKTLDVNALKVDGGDCIWSCKLCLGKLKQESMKLDGWSPASTLISPTVSLTSTDSCVSNCSDCSVDINSHVTENQEESTLFRGNEDPGSRLEKQLHSSCPATHVNRVDRSDTVMENNHMESTDRNNKCTMRDVEIMQTSVGEETGESSVESTIRSSNKETEMSNSEDNEFDTKFWEPPAAEDPEDDVEGSVANDDDDDECGDGTKWGKPSSLSSVREGSGSYKYHEEKQKAMDEVINEKFKPLVNQLLKSAGVSSLSKDAESWVDIVASLSWEAASFVRPDTVDGKAMDLEGCVKVKCIATGSCSESQVIKGLVFKKHASHKHMPTTHKNPGLLLIRGMLGQSSTELSSFNSMEQEQDYLKSIIDKIVLYHPNVVLVEKSVSHDIRASIFEKGMTLVFDMKLHRLERIARCTDSPIISSDALMDPKLGHCDHFYFEKFVEEHASVGEGGKRPIKNLMFLEGCPTRQCCTILLKGTHSDELKRIKTVVHYATVIAYRLILETSFLVDQKAMFSTNSFTGVAKVSPTDQQTSFVGSKNSRNVNHEVSTAKSDSSCTPFDIPISTAFHEDVHNLNLGLEDISTFRDPAILCENSLGTRKVDAHNEDQTQSNGGIKKGLASQSILVLMSRRNASRGTICEQSHFHQIKFYKNFDIPLGKFLQDNILNQRHPCISCGELPEAHFYYYAHHSKQLTIQVRRLIGEKRLSGEAEAKLWMWSRCAKCAKSKTGSESSKSTKRVLISTAARGLSFGKFLELSFSGNLSSSTLSTCGHSMQKDFFLFFGLGPMVAMLSYSPVAIYTVSLPPQTLEFNNLISQESLEKETKELYAKGILLFTEIEISLKKLGSQFAGSTLNLHGSIKDFSDIEEMLKQERSEFENAVVGNRKPDQAGVGNGKSDQAVHKFLRLNRLLWELFLEACIWDRRLDSLLSPDIVDATSTDKVTHGLLRYGTADRGTDGTDIVLDNGEIILDDGAVAISKSDTFVEAGEVSNNEIPVEVPVQASGDGDDPLNKSTVVEEIDRPTVGSLNLVNSSDQGHSGDDNCQEGSFSSDHLVDRTIPITPEIADGGSVVNLNLSQTPDSPISSLEKSKSVWTPFSELRREYVKDLQGGFLPKFESISTYTPELLPTVQRLITEGRSRLHIPLDTEEFIVSDYEDELSSVIACALALLKDLPLSAEDFDEDKGLAESSHSFTGISSMTSARWSSAGSLHTDGKNSTSTLEESRFSSFDGLSLLDSLVSFRAFHPEISLRVGNLPGKVKYSVVCLYATQFRDLRNRCCPSENDFIASLSRCRSWDAQGGKSKSFFAKTMDERFIIKEIKKTEYDSFKEFALGYFEHMNQSFESRNQTCLAKILGVYQVIIKQTKSGKEMRHDLMVMENLTFGRNITRQYDLKGALHSRLNHGSGDVLLDQNFVNDMNASPLYISNNAKRILERAVWNDTNFLNSINVMDYSLLVGVDTQRHELVCGIIDFLRQYTWDKQLETWVKSSLVVPKNVLPTIVSPKEYKKRFRKFMSRYFLCIPDHWCSESSSIPCQLCENRDDGSSQIESQNQVD